MDEETVDNDILVSFLIPSRKRINSLLDSLESICKNHTQKEKIEILIAIDDDDIETIENIPKIKNLTNNKNIILKLIIIKRLYYQNINEYYNILGQMAKGNLLWLWNDDALLLTPKWDFHLKEDFINSKTPYIYMRTTEILTNNSIHQKGLNYQIMDGGFPLISQKVHNSIGCISPHQATDTFLYNICMFELESYCSMVICHNQITTDYWSQREPIASSISVTDEDIVLLRNKIRKEIKEAKYEFNENMNSYNK